MTGRRAAVTIAVLSSLALFVLVAVIEATQRLVVREVVGGCAAILVGVTAWLWLRRDNKQRGGQS